MLPRSECESRRRLLIYFYWFVVKSDNPSGLRLGGFFYA